MKDTHTPWFCAHSYPLRKQTTMALNPQSQSTEPFGNLEYVDNPVSVAQGSFVGGGSMASDRNDDPNSWYASLSAHLASDSSFGYVRTSFCECSHTTLCICAYAIDISIWGPTSQELSGDNNRPGGERYPLRLPPGFVSQVIDATTDRQEKYVVERIIDSQWSGPELYYLVRWTECGEDKDKWLTRRELEGCGGCEALDIWMNEDRDLKD